MDEQDVVDSLGASPAGDAGAGLISQSQWGAVRALFERRMGKKAIARELGLDVKTVKKWLRQDFEPQHRRSRGRLADGLAEFLRARAVEVGFNGAVLFREAKERGFSGSYSALARFVSPWRSEFRGLELATRRFETEPGKQAPPESVPADFQGHCTDPQATRETCYLLPGRQQTLLELLDEMPVGNHATRGLEGWSVNCKSNRAGFNAGLEQDPTAKWGGAQMKYGPRGTPLLY